MNTDIRLQLGFLQNPKVRKLRMKHGDIAVLTLIELWCFAAAHRPDGVLRCMDKEDVLLACSAHTHSMLDAFVEHRFLEIMPDGIYKIHQWEDHQPWACKAEKRSSAAQKAANTRWEKQEEKRDLNATRMRPVCEEHAERNAPILSLPESKPKKRGVFTPPTLAEVAEYCRERGNGIDPQHFIDKNMAVGWVVGTKPMVDWKAVIRTWENYQKRQNNLVPIAPPKMDDDEFARRLYEKTLRETTRG